MVPLILKLTIYSCQNMHIALDRLNRKANISQLVSGELFQYKQNFKVPTVILLSSLCMFVLSKKQPLMVKSLSACIRKWNSSQTKSFTLHTAPAEDIVPLSRCAVARYVT